MGWTAGRAAAAANFGQNPLHGLFVQLRDALGQQIGKLGGGGAQVRRIDHDPGMRQPGEPNQILCLVPYKIEIAANLLDQTGGGAAASILGSETGAGSGI